MAKPMATDGLTTIRPTEKTERPALLAHTIEQACDALRKLLNSGLNRKAIIILVADDTRVGRQEINLVLQSLENLSKTYCS